MSITITILFILLLLLGLQIFSENGRHFWSLHLVLKAILLGAGLLCPIAFAINQAFYLKLTPLSLSLISASLIGTCYFAGLRPKWSQFINSGGYSSIIWEAIILVLVFFKATALFNIPLYDFDSLYYHLPLTRAIVQGGFMREIGPSYNLEIMGAYPQVNFFLYALVKELFPALSYFALPKIYYFLMLLMMTLSLNHIFKINNIYVAIRFPLLILLVCCFPDTISIQYLPCLLLVYFIEYLYTNREQEWRLTFKHGLYLSTIFWSNYLGILIVFILSSTLLLYFRLAYLKFNKSFFVGAALIFILLIRNLIMAHNPIYPGFIESIGGIGVTDDWLKYYDVTKRIPLTFEYQLILIFDYRIYFIPYLIAIVLLAFRSTRIFATIQLKKIHVGMTVLMGLLYVMLWAALFIRDATPFQRYLLPHAYTFLVLGAGELCLIIKYFLPTSLTNRTNENITQLLIDKRKSILSLMIPIILFIVMFNVSVDREAFNSYSAIEVEPVFRWINNKLPDNAVIFTMENRLFILNRNFVPGDSPKIFNYYLEFEPKKALDALKKQGITHVLYTQGLLNRSPFVYGLLINDLNTLKYQKIVYNDDYVTLSEIIYP